MYYIRFLKQPTLSAPNKANQCTQVKSLITMASDLGDAFYPGDVTVWATVRDSSIPRRGCKHEQWIPMNWRAGARSLPIQHSFLESRIVWPIQLLVTTQRRTLTDGSKTPGMEDQGIQLPDIVSAWSMPLEAAPDQEVQRMVERRFSLSSTHELRIYEETGDSIARHIWDAGLALSIYLSQTILNNPPSILPRLHSLFTAPSTNLRILELGAGCGIVSLSLAHLLPSSSILLTDTPEAQPLITHNINSFLTTSSPTTTKPTISFKVLQWQDPLPQKVAEQRFDLILVADCTYNPSSVPSLVTTLAALVQQSPHTLIIVAMKMRHESEKVFFELMAKAGLKELAHVAVPLPGAFSESEEKVDIYEYVGSEYKTRS
ncbi:MAG: hypothetical protein M1835_002487 [Candelina submexicana]|nr:MAG: hypothetical protein M1835_002487 [Candelina submexicana]